MKVKNRILKFAKPLVKRKNEEFVLVSYATPNGIKKRLQFHDFPEAEYIGMTGAYYTFLFKGIHGQDAPIMGYCILKRN
jgi:hypothetical protein